MPILYSAPAKHVCPFPNVTDHTDGTIWECPFCEARWQATIGDYGRDWWPISRQWSDRVIRRAKKNGGG